MRVDVLYEEVEVSVPESYEGQVVVGFDGSSVGSHALDWAAMFAAKRGLPVTVVTAVQLPPPSIGDGTWFDPTMELVDAAAKRDLTAGLEQLAASHPDVKTAGVSDLDSPARLLIEASRTARLTVVGSRGRSELAGLMLGSVSNAVAAHAHGPVVIVPRTVPADGTGPIVIGVEAGQDGRAALDFGLRTAAEVDLPVVLVHAWGVLRSWALADAQYAELTAAVESESKEFLQGLVDYAHQEHPDLSVQTISVHGSPAAALIEQSKAARMVVVGSRGRGGFSGLLLGSTSRGVLHSSAAPIAIVRAPRETT